MSQELNSGVLIEKGGRSKSKKKNYNYIDKINQLIN